MDRGVPDFIVEQLALGEAPEEERRALLSRDDVRERIRALERSDAEILRDYPPARMAELIRERAALAEADAAADTDAARGDRSESSAGAGPNVRGRVIRFRGSSLRPKSPRIIGLVAALCIVAIGIVPLVLEQRRSADSVIAETIRIKGLRPSLRIYRELDGSAEVLENGSEVHERDLLQIGYISGGEKYGIILSIDGRGTTTLHYPLSPASGTELERSGEVILPYSYELDDAPGFERFFFITSDTPIPVDRILDSARKLARESGRALKEAIPVPGGMEQFSIVRIKD